MQARTRAAFGHVLLLALAVVTALGLAAAPAAGQTCDTATAEQPAGDTPPICPVEDGVDQAGGGAPESGTGADGSGAGGGGADGDAVGANRIDAGGGGTAGPGIPVSSVAIAAGSALAGAALLVASRRRA